MSTQTIDAPLATWLVDHANDLLSAYEWPVDILQLTTQFRRQFSPAQSHLLCELLELRHRGRKKFSRSAEMFFSRQGLEQATDEKIATYKSRRFANRQWHIVDLCCGIGGDALSLAEIAEQLTIIDKDPAIALFAVANAKQHDFSGVNQQIIDIRDADFAAFDAWHIDPDRRPHQHRISSPDLCEPGLSEFLQLPHLPHDGAIKLSPAADADHLLSQGAELEWIGHDRECQQQVAWFGSLARYPGKKTATWLNGNGERHDTLIEIPDQPIAIVGEQPQYLYEPHPNVLAAGLERALAIRLQLSMLSANSVYYASDHFISSPQLSAFRVIDEMAFHRKKLKQRLVALDRRVVEVKKRGVSLDPNRLLREFTRDASHDTVLLLYRQQDAIRVAITERIHNSTSRP